ncbi:MAG: hypothetical protein ACI8T1_005136, partial [Verrucomicrobiales bacterium]
FFGWRKCERHVACHSNGELPRVFSDFGMASYGNADFVP